MIKNLTNVRGIKCWGAHTGVKSMRRDLALIYSEVPASAAATFTQNQVVAEPIKIAQRHLKSGLAQVFVVNAGNANACTGEQGRQGAEAMVEATAEELGIDRELVVIASTGVIGEPFPTEDIVNGIRENVVKLSNRSEAGSFTASAILTTDTYPKEGHVSFALEGHEIQMAGIAKGSGMIHPNMATMLCFLVTDLAIEPPLLRKALKRAVDLSFNMITVDGDTSTNDMVAIMANGLAGNDPLRSEDDPNYQHFCRRLEAMCMHLAKMIVSDGEGSSKFVEYRVQNAPDEATARKLVRGISSSTLVKTAMYGRDPNWGRIVCAAGNAGVPFDFATCDLRLGDEERSALLVEAGQSVEFDRNYIKKLLRESHIYVTLDLHAGEASAVGWGSDLTTDYVLFNSVYTT
jgi:glutamate N-acetyltransferase/amino-acid N-acetyltransferase